MKGYNAYFGCFHCRIHGEFFPSRRHIYYPVPQNRVEKAKQLKLRKAHRIPKQARQVPYN